jgi:carbonic anhydrase/acetyltransferase-like protein (isoleucine patch superfamily)
MFQGSSPAAPPTTASSEPTGAPTAAEPVRVRTPRRARLPFGLVAGLYLRLIFGLPCALVAALLAVAAPYGWVPLAAAALVSPLLFAVLFVLVAGLLSRPHQHAVKPGLFARDLGDPTYRGRRLYGLCWTSLYYFTPLYFVALSLPWLKRLTFRLFGYRGQMDFTVYPDTWIRDLPLLDFGPGAYVSNKATLGTNVARANGMLLVDHIRVGPNALVGHLSMLSTGTVLEEGAEVGVGCAVGSKVLMRRNASVGPCCAVGHLSDVGEGADVGWASSLGAAVRIAAGVRLPQASLVPNRARLGDQRAADALISSALSPISRLAGRLSPVPAPARRHWNEFE